MNVVYASLLLVAATLVVTLSGAPGAASLVAPLLPAAVALGLGLFALARARSEERAVHPQRPQHPVTSRSRTVED